GFMFSLVLCDQVIIFALSILAENQRNKMRMRFYTYYSHTKNLLTISMLAPLGILVFYKKISNNKG
ncbi:MAG: hypothetical protein K2G68_08215, partial [Helicobacter sp.]|nr:hypothetical protein [Helicobacter sp.]